MSFTSNRLWSILKVFPRMRHEMRFQSADLSKTLFAYVAWIRPFASVSSVVHFQAAVKLKRFTANLASLFLVASGTEFSALYFETRFSVLIKRKRWCRCLRRFSSNGWGGGVSGRKRIIWWDGGRDIHLDNHSIVHVSLANTRRRKMRKGGR